jgi:hypothetical protein
MYLPRNYKAIALLPLTFIVNSEGFAMFAPYAVLMLSAAYLLRRVRTPQPQPQAVPVTQ